MIRGPWWTDDDLIEFGYGYSDESLVMYWIGNYVSMEGNCIFYHFQVKDGKIWFYTDEEIKEIEGTYGLWIKYQLFNLLLTRDKLSPYLSIHCGWQ